MKNLVTKVLLTVCLSFFQDLYAQKAVGPGGKDVSTATSSKHELRIGYGLLSDIQLIAAFTDTYTTITSGISGEPASSEYPTVGPVIASYTFSLSPRITLGPELNLMQLNINNLYTSGEKTHDRFFIVNLSARLDVCYLNKENIRLYSGASLGGSYIFEQSTDPGDENNSAPFLSYQLNFFGIRFGKSLAGYTEFGFGRNGLMNLGISKRF